MTAVDRIRILIVENEGLVGCDIAATLANLGYHVVDACRSGERAVERVLELHPDLVLMDIHLAGSMDGIETARRIRQIGSAAVVYVTACADLDTVARARETQPHGYLLKPFSEDELRLAVEAAASGLPASQPDGTVLEHVANSVPLVDVGESISDPLIALDRLWRLTYVNAAGAELFSRDRLAILGTNFWDLVPRVVRDIHFDTLAHGMLHRDAVCRDLHLEARQIWLELRAYPFGEGLLILMKDITARHEEAERLNRIDRLESLGLLARGFAHDFNNLLTILLGNLSLAEMRLRGNTERSPELATAKQATLQAQNLVQQLLTFACGGVPVKRQVKPGELIETFFLHHSRAADIHYGIEIQKGLPMIAVDPNQIRRLLGNLIRNAEQAMHGGGDLAIRCLAPDPEELYGIDGSPDMSEHPQGIVIEVKDSGEGIAPDHLPHIFEPYFSTRKAQNATGLGLTVCESIAKAHGGSLSVRSEHGHGSTVRFYLPVDADEEAADGLGLSRGTFDLGAASSAPRILILEDDPLVRRLITRNLATQGFEVCETAEGTDTIRRYQESMDQGRTFDLVVLDLTIPNGLGGILTMERLRLLDPNVVAIVSSGYCDDPVMARPAAYGFSAVLPKPYESSDLLRLVKGVLNARGLRKDSKA